ncbi:MAG: M24 family metallopeptidase [Bacteroidota bacterium]|nr:M24 family metallopeptidase [Bacteroidota bacterium]
MELNEPLLHYDKNKRRMKAVPPDPLDNRASCRAGHVVVMDVGAEYNGYTADITRTIPLSGKFTKAQKEIYNVVLKAQKEVIKIIKQGVPLRDLDKKTKEVNTAVLGFVSKTMCLLPRTGA